MVKSEKERSLPREKDCPFNHNPMIDFNDEALETGIEMHYETARCFVLLWSQEA
jgi:hypothetical protein